MRLFDVNVLVNAHRADNARHEFFRDWLVELLEGPASFLYTEWVLAAFVRIVTHPRIYRTPTPLEMALEFTEEVRRRPNGVAIMPGARHWGLFRELCKNVDATGNLIPDAYLAALAIEADAEWVTSDAGFARFEPELRWTLLSPS